MKIRANLDHIVVAVRNLKTAVMHYEALGFKVEFGGNNGPTQNALISFQDGSYIELISSRSTMFRWLAVLFNRFGLLLVIERVKPSLSLRFLYWFASPEGFKDWCVRGSNLAETAVNLTDGGLAMTRVEQFSRNKPDGQIAQWMLVAPQNRALPFLIEDITPVNARVPQSGANSHPNGANGISILHLVTGTSRRRDEEDLLLLLGKDSETWFSEHNQGIGVAIEFCNEGDNSLSLVTAAGDTLQLKLKSIPSL